MTKRALAIATAATAAAVLLVAGLAWSRSPKSGANPRETIKLDPGTSKLSIEVQGVRSSKGMLACSLHQDGETFPGASRIIGGGLEQMAAEGNVLCTWENVPAGTYAVSVFHDEND